MGTILGNKEYEQNYDEPLFGGNIRNDLNNPVFNENKVDIALLRECWSAACASGHNHFPSLDKMQQEFENWMDEKKINWRTPNF